MSDELRAMLESAQSPPVLQRLYLDLRELVDQVSSNLLPLESLAASIQPLSLQAPQAQEQSLDLKHDVDSLREVLHALSKDTSREASGHDAHILVLSSRLEELTRRSSHSSSVETRIEQLYHKLSDTQANIATVLGEIQGLRELTKNLTAENALLRGHIRDLESSAQVPHEPQTSQAARQSVADQANTTPPRYTTQKPPLHGQGVKPPTFEEFMRGVRAPHTGTSTVTQVQAIPAVTTNSLKPVTAPSLVTTCDVPTSVPQVPQDYPHDMGFTQEGPYCPGLVPHVPMLTPFKLVVSYRHYRLKDTRADLHELESTMLYKVKRRFDSLYPTFHVFDSTKPIKLLEFLTTVREGFNALRASEALAVLALAYYLDGQAKTHYTALTTPGVRTTTSILGETWPALVDSFIKRYLTDDILQAAYDKITDAK